VDASERVYLQKKRRSYRGREQYHTVEAGENLYDVAQRYGLRLDILAKRNRLREQDDPATGSQIKLRGGKVGIDKIPLREGMKDPNAPIEGVPTNEDDLLDVVDPTEEPEADPYPIYPPTTPSTTTPPTTTPPPAPTTNPQPGPVIVPRPSPNPPTNNPTYPPTTTTTTSNPPVVRPGNVPPTNPSTSTQFHSVVAGETLYAISRKYGLTVDRLKELNRLSSNLISIGQQLRVK